MDIAKLPVCSIRAVDGFYQAWPCCMRLWALAGGKSGNATRGGKAERRRRKDDRRAGDKFSASHPVNLRSSLSG